VLHRQSCRALVLPGYDERSDLDDLTIAPGGGTSLLLCLGDGALGLHAVALMRGHHREQGLLDGLRLPLGQVGHPVSVLPGADAALSPH
jgi:hypothetical protein